MMTGLPSAAWNGWISASSSAPAATRMSSTLGVEELLNGAYQSR